MGKRGSLFLEDQYKLTNWLTLNGGVRLTHFGFDRQRKRGRSSHWRCDPHAALNWVLRGFYGRYYQAPPLLR